MPKKESGVGNIVRSMLKVFTNIGINFYIHCLSEISLHSRKGIRSCLRGCWIVFNTNRQTCWILPRQCKPLLLPSISLMFNFSISKLCSSWSSLGFDSRSKHSILYCQKFVQYRSLFLKLVHNEQLCTKQDALSRHALETCPYWGVCFTVFFVCFFF